MQEETKKAETPADFKPFHFDPRIETGIKALGFGAPTTIQAQAIPPILENRDVLGVAQTGTGKTAAFVLPILQRLLTGPRRQIRAIIIAPTRELVDQIHEAVCRLGAATKLGSVTVYGGVPKYPQIKKLRSGAEIVVACPGRLLDLMGQGAVRASGLDVLVLDEADRMFDMGFLPDIKEIVGKLPAKRQTLLFSATMPREIRQLTKEMMENPQMIRVDDDRPASTVSHTVYPVESHRKTALLMRLLDKTELESVLVFTRTRERATTLALQIQDAGMGATSLRGDLPQTKRQEALRGFRNGRYRVLVATDIAARGIDVSRISHVINYDMPDTVDAYTHRIGRTGRAERTGDAFSFVTRGDRSFVWAIEKVLGETVEKRILEDFNYGVSAAIDREGGRSRRPAAPKAPSRTPGRPQERQERWTRPSMEAGKPAAGFRKNRKSFGR